MTTLLRGEGRGEGPRLIFAQDHVFSGSDFLKVHEETLGI